MSAPSPDKNEPSTITGSRFVGRNITQGTNSMNLHAIAVQYDRQKYGLFCKTRPPVSFVMSTFKKQNLVKLNRSLCKPTKNKEFCGGF